MGKRQREIERRKKISISMKKRWKTKEFKEKQREAMNRPEYREKQSKRMKEHWAEPGNKEKQSKARKKYFENPENREKNRETQNRPENREKLSKATKKYFEKPENREKMSKIKKKYFKNPENRERHREVMNKPETKKKQSKTKIKLWQGPIYREKMIIAINKIPKKGRGKNGIRKDLDHYVRSTWEANYCRVLKYLKIDYEYEPEIFHLKNNGSTISYIPDIYIPSKDQWIEIKGYMREDDQLKHDLFRAEGHNLVIIGEKEYKLMEMTYRGIVEWEQ